MKWTPEQDRQLTELWNEGRLSASLIAIELGTTKDAVVGRSHRLGLASRLAVLTKDGKTYTRMSVKPRGEPAMTKIFDRVDSKAGPAVRKEASASVASLSRLVVKGDMRYVTLQALKNNECRWPTELDKFSLQKIPTQPTETFCGRPTVIGSSYCRKHKEQSQPGGT